jgi:predicted secreted protein
MPEPMQDITFTIPATEAIQRHIESLQASLTKRNEQIQRLVQQLEEERAGSPQQSRLDAEYRRGWKDAANHLVACTAEAARALGKVRKDAFQIYLQKDAD